MRQFNGWRTFHSLQSSVNRRFRNGVSFGFNDTWVLYDHAIAGARIQHAADGSYSFRADQAQADKLLAYVIPNKHIFKGNFVWDLPDLKSSEPALKAVGLVVNDWQLSGVWTGLTGTAYNVGYSYSSGGGNVNITGSNDFAGRVRIVGDPGSGCSKDMYRQFNAAAFQGPADEQRRPRVARRLPARLLPERARPDDRPQHPAGRRPQPAAAGRHVQRAEPGHRLDPQQHDDAGQPGGSGHGLEPPVRRDRGDPVQSRETERFRIRAGANVAGGAQHAVPDSILVLLGFSGFFGGHGLHGFRT